MAEAFNLAIKNKAKIIGVVLRKNERRIDIGTPESYANVLVSLRWKNGKFEKKCNNYMKNPVVSIVGLGFVGLSLAVASAKKKFDTYGIEINERKLRKLRSGKSDFFEPKLENYLKESLNRKKLFLTNDLKDVLTTHITFLTLVTPAKNNGQIALSQLEKVSSNLSKIFKVIK